MDNEINYTYDKKSEGNILVVGRTGCVKLHLSRTWEKIRCSVTLKKLFGYRKYHFPLKEKIRDCFIEQKVDFNYPNNEDDFDDLLGFC